VLQVLRLGAPVTSLSLAPDATLLATTHVERAGVYLWANQQVFGSGADVVPSNKPLDARLPTVGTGRGAARAAAAAGEGGAATGAARRAAALQAMLRHSAGRDGGANGAVADAADGPAAAALFADDSDLSASDLEVASSDGGGGGSASDSDADSDGAAAAAGPAAGAAYARRDAAGAPAPLAPRLITLSMLPRAQWMNLVHLDAIKARNRPTAPPAKPAAAPFFLPTLRGPGAGRAPVFDLSGGLAAPAGDAPAGGGGAKRKSVAAAAAAAWGAGSGDDDEGGGSGEEEEEDEGGGAPGASRVLRDRAPGAPGGGSRLVALLRVCAAAGDWTSLVAHLRSLPPSELDGELRAMALLEGSPPEAERDVELLLEFLEAQAAAGAGFEHAQAVLRAALAAHGDALAARPALRAAAARLEARLGAGWRRLDALLQGARCAVGLLLGQHGA
jgi:U3 small nucleolar RNA-associated protein 21